MELHSENLFEKLLTAKQKPSLFYNPQIDFPFEKLRVKIEKSSLVQEGFLFPSSGSSGVFKWVHHDEKTLLCSAKNVVKFLGLTSKDVQLIVLPTFHVGGFSQWVRGTVARCQSFQLLSKKWNPQMFLKAVDESSATVTSLVPTQLYDLVSLSLPAPKTLRVVMLGGAALSESLYFQARELGWPVLPSYGMSEAASTIACARVESLAQRDYPPLEVMDHWLKLSLGRNCGRLKLAGEALMRGVLEVERVDLSLDYKKIEKSLSYKTGDLVSIQSLQGQPNYLKFLGRVDRRIKILGEWVNLDSIEQEIRLSFDDRDLSVAETSWELFARECSRKGARLFLVLEAAAWPQNSADELKLLLQKRLNSLELIEDICFVTQIPRSPLGKFLPSELKI